MNVFASLFNSLQQPTGGLAAPEASADLLSGLPQQNLGADQEDFASLLSDANEEINLASPMAPTTEAFALPGLSLLGALQPPNTSLGQISQINAAMNQSAGMSGSPTLTPLAPKAGPTLPKQNDQELLVGRPEGGLANAQHDKLVDQAAAESSTPGPSAPAPGADIQQLIMSSPLVQALTSRNAASQGLVDGSQLAKDVQKAGSLTEYLDTPVNIKEFLQKLGVPDQTVNQMLSGTRAMTESATPRMILEEAGIPVKVFEGLAKSLNMKSPANALAVPAKGLANQQETQHQSNLRATLASEQHSKKTAGSAAPALGPDLVGKGTLQHPIPLNQQHSQEIAFSSVSSMSPTHQNKAALDLANASKSISAPIAIHNTASTEALQGARHGARDLYLLQQELGISKSLAAPMLLQGGAIEIDPSTSPLLALEGKDSMIANTAIPGIANQNQGMNLQDLGFDQARLLQTASTNNAHGVEKQVKSLSNGELNLSNLLSAPLRDKDSAFLNQDEDMREQEGRGESQSGLADPTSISQLGLNTGAKEFSVFEQGDVSRDKSNQQAQWEPDINPILEKVINATQSMVNRNGGQFNLQIPSEVYGDIGIQIQVEKEQVRLKIASQDQDLKESLNGAMESLQANLKGNALELIEVSFTEASGQSFGQNSGQDQGRFAWDQGMRDYVDAETGLPELQELLGKAGKFGPFGGVSSQYKLPMGQSNSQIHLLT